jgi:hypothetical protein
MIEDLKFKCSHCGKRLDFFEVFMIPGEQIYDEISDLQYHTSRRFCEACYKQFTSENILNKQPEILQILNKNGVDKKLIEEYFKIKQQMSELEERRKELNYKIKQTMLKNNIVNFEFDNLKIWCATRISINYLRKNVEKFIQSEELLNKIRTQKETSYLFVEEKKKN